MLILKDIIKLLVLCKHSLFEVAHFITHCVNRQIAEVSIFRSAAQNFPYHAITVNEIIILSKRLRLLSGSIDLTLYLYINACNNADKVSS